MLSFSINNNKNLQILKYFFFVRSVVSNRNMRLRIEKTKTPICSQYLSATNSDYNFLVPKTLKYTGRVRMSRTYQYASSVWIMCWTLIIFERYVHECFFFNFQKTQCFVIYIIHVIVSDVSKGTYGRSAFYTVKSIYSYGWYFYASAIPEFTCFTYRSVVLYCLYRCTSW